MTGEARTPQGGHALDCDEVVSSGQIACSCRTPQEGRALEAVTSIIANGVVAWADADRENNASRYPIPAWADYEEIAEKVLAEIAKLSTEGGTTRQGTATAETVGSS